MNIRNRGERSVIPLGNTPVHYDRRGEGYPLVILHALGTDHRSMKAWIEPLFENRAGWQRIYLDLPAHGQSRVPDWVKTSDHILSILLEFLDTIIPTERFALAGKSFGGYVAQGIFGKKAELIDGLCLMVPPLHKKDRSLPVRRVLERDEEALSGLDEDIATAFETLMVYQTRQNLRLFLEEVQPGRLLADRDFLTSEWRTQGYFFSFDPIEKNAVYPQPALFLLGRQDSICGFQDQWELLEHFPHATFSVLDRAGHMPEIEQRHLVQTLFSDWLDRVEMYTSGK
jgi:pimeloyl-ACP methyl ester carboxylesterase